MVTELERIGKTGIDPTIFDIIVLCACFSATGQKCHVVIHSNQLGGSEQYEIRTQPQMDGIQWEVKGSDWVSLLVNVSAQFTASTRLLPPKELPLAQNSPKIQDEQIALAAEPGKQKLQKAETAKVAAETKTRKEKMAQTNITVLAEKRKAGLQMASKAEKAAVKTKGQEIVSKKTRKIFKEQLGRATNDEIFGSAKKIEQDIVKLGQMAALEKDWEDEVLSWQMSVVDNQFTSKQNRNSQAKGLIQSAGGIENIMKDATQKDDFENFRDLVAWTVMSKRRAKNRFTANNRPESQDSSWIKNSTALS
eukprot:2048683-Rhodomonas_salina.3